MYPCKEPDCAERFDSAADLLNHAADDHGYTIIRPQPVDESADEGRLDAYLRYLCDDQPDDPEADLEQGGIRHNNDFPCPTGQPYPHPWTQACSRREPYVAIPGHPDEFGSNITGITVSPEDLKFLQDVADHPATREIISRLSGIPGVNLQQITEVVRGGKTTVTVTVWLQS